MTMPILRGIGDNLSTLLAMNKFFRGAGPTDPEQYSYWMNFVRIVDKTVRSYNNAKREINKISDGQGRLVFTIKAGGYLEDCLSNLALAIKFLKKITSNNATGYPNIDRATRRLLFSLAEPMLSFRNDIQHLENAWINHHLAQNDTVCLIIRNDRIIFANKEILFSDLVSCISKLHTIAKSQALWGL